MNATQSVYLSEYVWLILVVLLHLYQKPRAEDENLRSFGEVAMQRSSF